MSTNPVRLADFTNGYHRHPDDDGIVFTSQIAIFHAAAKDASNRAAILILDPAEKARQRALLQSAWADVETCGKNEFVAVNYQGKIKRLDQSLAPIESILSAMSQSSEIINDKNHTEIAMMKNWRLPELDKPHDHLAVLTKVLLSKGPVLPINSGYFQLDEADEIYMKDGCPHYPERATTDNEDQPRFTMICM